MYKTVIHKKNLGDAEKDSITAVVAGELEQRAEFTLLHHGQAVSAEGLQHLRAQLGLDINSLPPDFSSEHIRLLITDMDSTFISIECIDEIADFAGVKPQVKAITDAAMRGEINFEASLKQRVALLKGLDEAVLQEVYEQRLQLNPGADLMLAALRQHSISTALVSGGFTFFTDRLKQRYQLDFTLSNVLQKDNGILTGKVNGDIVGAQAKADFLLQLMEQNNWLPEQVIAMGDGANDLLMLAQAGLSIAYHAKPKVRAEAAAQFNHIGLDGVCHFLDS